MAHDQSLRNYSDQIERIAHKTLFRAIQVLSFERIISLRPDPSSDRTLTHVSEEISIAMPIIELSRVGRLFFGVGWGSKVDDQGVAANREVSSGWW